ncbi:MAG TPA: amidohydrolase, partial [Thermoanaerobaculia bacterium]|nr:amidohydrolase [Thermoanaerobaculia bacterium]
MNKTLCVVFSLLLPAAASAQSFAVTNARIFDGERLIPRGTVVVRDGKIESVGADVKVPEGVQAVDAAGATLLPGLIDSHTHVFPGVLERALAFGVTTELDMGGDPAPIRSLREEQARPGGAPGRADVLSSGYFATTAGSHGTQFGMALPTLSKPEEAASWVDARLAEGSDYIKIIVEDFSAYGATPTPFLSKETVAALVQATHSKGKLAVAHIGAASFARTTVEAGVDALVHIFADRVADADFVRLAAERKIFVVPTLTVVESYNGV